MCSLLSSCLSCVAGGCYYHTTHQYCSRSSYLHSISTVEECPTSNSISTTTTTTTTSTTTTTTTTTPPFSLGLLGKGGEEVDEWVYAVSSILLTVIALLLLITLRFFYKSLTGTSEAPTLPTEEMESVMDSEPQPDSEETEVPSTIPIVPQFASTPQPSPSSSTLFTLSTLPPRPSSASTSFTSRLNEIDSTRYLNVNILNTTM